MPLMKYGSAKLQPGSRHLKKSVARSGNARGDPSSDPLPTSASNLRRNLFDVPPVVMIDSLPTPLLIPPTT